MLQTTHSSNAKKFNAKSRAFYILWLVFAIYLIDFADRKVISVLFESIKHDWHMTDVQLSFLEGITSLVIAVCVLPMAIIIDRWSRKYMIAIMVGAWSVITFLCAFAENYEQLLLLRALIGVGEAAYAPAAVSLISKVFPVRHRSKYIGVFDAAAPFGVALGMVVGGYIGMVYGWRHAFGLVAIPGIIFAVMALWIRDYHTIPLYRKAKKVKFSFSHIQDLFAIRTLVLVCLAFSCMVGVNTAVLDWAPSFFMRVHSLSQAQAGGVSAIIAVSALLGAPLGGYIADRWNVVQKSAKIYVSAISTCCAGICLLLAISLENAYAVYICFGLFGMCTVAFLGPATAIIQEVVQPGMRTIAFGINVIAINVLGSFAMIMLVGYISDMYSIRIALLSISLFAFIAAFLFIIAKRFYTNDICTQ